MEKIIINKDVTGGKINKNIYGHFSEHLGRCIYDGIYVGNDSTIPNTRGIRNDIIKALKDIKTPVLRWPGGCFADEYHWMDGIGEKSQRKRMVNTHWGMVVEDNSFGTHEFMDLCELVGSEAYICGNVGSGTVREMQEWIEYITFDGISPMAKLRGQNGHENPWKLKYFGVGNENWGCGGNMTPDYYANEYKRYATYVRSFGGNKVYKIACGSNGSDFNWTDVLMREAGRHMNGLSLHHYTIPTGDWGKKGSAKSFTESEYLNTMNNALQMDNLISKHKTIMDKYDAEKRVGLIIDEWGIWTDVEPGTNPGFLFQQNSMRDALIASVNFDIFNKHSDRVQMANIAQTVNVLQAVILTEGEKLVLTPTFYAFKMYNAHHDATYLPLTFNSPIIDTGKNKIKAVSGSASYNDAGEINITLTNLDPLNTYEFEIDLRGDEIADKNMTSEILTSEKLTDINKFGQPETVKIVSYDGVSKKGEKIIIKLPQKSIVGIKII